MPSTPAYAALHAGAPLAPFTLERRAPGPREVLIDILYCGICHSDVHQARGEWGGRDIFPMVPGHEIVGRVAEAGAEVTRWRVGDAVGVGCFVDSCRQCAPCAAGEEQHCALGMSATYNSYERGADRRYDKSRPTYGGYSTRITVDQDYVLRIPDGLPLDAAAPLLCAGITTYAPLRRFGVRAGHRVAVVGLGGLGHVAVKLAAAMGAEVTVLSSSEGKRGDALALGAHAFAATGDAATFEALAGAFDLILDTVSAAHDYNAYLSLLKFNGAMVLLGIPVEPLPVAAGVLIRQRRTLTGSLIGGIRETQEMLDFCAAHGVAADIELIAMAQVNDAYERMLRADVRYRFVIDVGAFARQG